MNEIRNVAYDILTDSVSDCYSHYIIDDIIDDVVDDVEEAADGNWNEDDVRFAIGRVLMKRLNLFQ